MLSYQNRSVIITGGSSGIGEALALEFAERGARLFLIARRLDALLLVQEKIRNQFPDVQVTVYSQDVGEASGMEKVILEIGENHGIDLLICNAGISGSNYFDQFSASDYQAVMQVNYLGAIHCLLPAWPYLKSSEQGQVGLVSSVAGYLGIIGYPTYVPTKFAVVGLAENLRMEGKPHGIAVSVIYPPDTRTPMLIVEGKEKPPETIALGDTGGLMEPGWVAKVFAKGLSKRKFEIFCNFETRFFRKVKYLFPRLYYFLLDRIAFRKSGS